MLYHGIDIIEVARVQQAIERWGPRFLRRVYTPGELEACAAFSAPRFQSLAARWAAKEAAAKALGVGLSGLGAGSATGDNALLHFHDLEVVRNVSGRPALRLHRGAAATAAALGIGEIALSLSHSAAYAVASVVALGAPLPARPGAAPGCDGVE